MNHGLQGQTREAWGEKKRLTEEGERDEEKIPAEGGNEMGRGAQQQSIGEGDEGTVPVASIVYYQ